MNQWYFAEFSTQTLYDEIMMNQIAKIKNDVSPRFSPTPIILDVFVSHTHKPTLYDDDALPEFEMKICTIEHVFEENPTLSGRAEQTDLTPKISTKI